MLCTWRAPLARTACVFALAVAGGGCDVEPLADGRAVDDINCQTCHGSEDNAAPPNAIAGGNSTASVGVGAHQAHVTDGLLREALDCSACHIVPRAVEDPGHIDALPAELAFGRLAASGGLVPMWDRREASCSATWCHGSGLEGGRKVRPIWTQVDGSQTNTCDSCHGNPPPLPHPPADDCARCHSQTASFSGEILVPNGFHINGVVDVDELSCTACHGSFGNPAPPTGLHGEDDASERAVGTHRSHMRASDWHAPVTCDECHVVPTALDDPGHADDLPPAELTWGATATAGGALPMFDGVGCSNVACHGGAMTASGGTVPVPEWTRADGTQAACGACHSLPPPSPHPNNENCAACHSAVMSSATEFDRPHLHIDGVVQVDGNTCTACHGGDGNPAPPADTAGNTATTERGVGAHRSHLADADWHAAIACEECHVVPANVDDVGHNDSALPAELVWGAVASADGNLPMFDGLNCTVYCHGATLGGGTNTAPAWTTVDGTQAACGSCHSTPPPAPHPAVSPTSCGGCHPFSGLLPNDPSRHVNGVVDMSP